jgi:branched-chain amino acid transport system substrate-binding protein
VVPDRRLKPDAIVMTGSLADTALIVKQYGELGLKIPIVGGGGHSTRAFRNIAGSASDGMVVVPAFWNGHFTNKEAVEFAKAFTEKYGTLEGDEWSMFAYDAVMMVAAAMERTRSTEGGKIIPELFKLGVINGAAGSYRVTPNGEIDTTVFIGTWAPTGKVDLVKAWAPPRLD